MSVKEQLSLVIRFVDLESNIREEFLGFIHCVKKSPIRRSWVADTCMEVDVTTANVSITDDVATLWNKLRWNDRENTGQLAWWTHEERVTGYRFIYMEILSKVFSLVACPKCGNTNIKRGHLLNLMQFVTPVKRTLNLKTHFGHPKKWQKPFLI